MAPIENWKLKLKLKRYIEATQEIIMAKDVAKPLSILSAYLTTIATMRPPPA